MSKRITACLSSSASVCWSGWLPPLLSMNIDPAQADDADDDNREGVVYS